MKKINLKNKLIRFTMAFMLAGSTLFANAKGTAVNDKLAGLAKVETALMPETFETLNFAGEIAPVNRGDVKAKFDKQMRMNIAHNDFVNAKVKRAVQWKPVIMPILEEEGVPADFFYLAVAESFLENATSHVGAQGFWQFMQPTAKEYGLVVNGSVDERYNPEKATRAACEYLKDAKAKLGSWTLAAASYNMGMGGVNKALNRQNKNNYYDLRLNPETGAYVYRILALKTIMENYDSYGYELSKEDLEPVVEAEDFVTNKTVDLKDLAKKYNTSVETLKVMNPWIKGTKLNANGKNYTVKVPVKILKDQSEWISEHRKSPPAEIYS